MRIGDVNYGGHLGNDSMLTLLNEARLVFLQKYGFSELDAGGAGLIMSDVAIVYKAEAFHGDLLLIEVAVAEIGALGCDLVYRVTHKKDGKEAARAKTGIVFFDYSTRKIVKTPEKFAQTFTKKS